MHLVAKLQVEVTLHHYTCNLYADGTFIRPTYLHVLTYPHRAIEDS